MDKETQFQIDLLDFKIYLVESALQNMYLSETRREELKIELSNFKDKRLGLKGAFRLS